MTTTLFTCQRQLQQQQQVGRAVYSWGSCPWSRQWPRKLRLWTWRHCREQYSWRNCLSPMVCGVIHLQERYTQITTNIDFKPNKTNKRKFCQGGTNYSSQPPESCPDQAPDSRPGPRLQEPWTCPGPGPVGLDSGL